MTLAIADNKSARLANPAHRTAPAAQNSHAIAPVGTTPAAPGKFASALATVQTPHAKPVAAPPIAATPAATPGKILPPDRQRFAGEADPAQTAPTGAHPTHDKPAKTGAANTPSTLTETDANPTPMVLVPLVPPPPAIITPSAQGQSGPDAEPTPPTATDTAAPSTGSPSSQWNSLQPPVMTASLSPVAAATANVAMAARSAVLTMTAQPGAPAPSGPKPVPLIRTSAVVASHALNIAAPDTRTADLPTVTPARPAVQLTANPPQSGGPAHSVQAETQPVSENPASSRHTPDSPAPTAVPMVATALETNPMTPTLSTPAVVETPTDFATLVDSIARARSEASANATGPVGVTLSHGDFGRVSLQITPRDQGLTVTMHSADPGFAPAVAAAASTSGGSDAGNHRSGQQPTDTANTDTASQNTASQNNPAPNNSTGGGFGQAPRGDTARQPNRPSLPGQPHGNSDAADDTGIFA